MDIIITAKLLGFNYWCSNELKVGIIDCEKVEILGSDLACYEKNEHFDVFTKLTELIANNFPTETCWISIHEN